MHCLLVIIKNIKCQIASFPMRYIGSHIFTLNVFKKIILVELDCRNRFGRQMAFSVIRHSAYLGYEQR